MIDHLPLFHRIAGQPVIVLGHGEAAEAKRRLVARAGGEAVGDIQDGIDRGARLDTGKLRQAFNLRLPTWETGVERMLSEILAKEQR